MRAVLVVFAALLVPAVTWAGFGLNVGPQGAPAMDEPGLMLLATGLVGAGFALVRRRHK